MTFDVTVQNQGESDETDVAVSIAITDGKDINVEQTIPRIAAGQEETVSIPISEQPDTQGVSNVTVEIAPVPGRGHEGQQPGPLRGGVHGISGRQSSRRQTEFPATDIRLHFWPPAVGISFKRAR